MHGSERRLVWVSAVVLTFCALGAVNSIWPSAVKAHAAAVVQRVSHPLVLTPTTVPAPVATATPPAPAPAPPPAAEPAPAPDPSGVNVLSVTVEHDGRVLRTTVRYPSTPGHYPLVVFAHGFAASAATYARLEEQLAASGLVVAAPDFPLTSSAVASSLDRSDVVNQAADVSAVIDFLVDAATTPAELQNVIASGPVGVVGHSDGGITAAAVAYNSRVADPRVAAAVILSGAKTMYGGTWFGPESAALLAIHGDDDGVNPYWSSEQLFSDATGPKWLVKVLGGSHGGPFTNAPVVAQVAVVTADFLHAYLSGDSAAAARIEADANADGLELDDAG
ncbi:MAG: alpha/beta hydrolase [Acidimicrobiia bacterium]